MNNQPRFLKSFAFQALAYLASALVSIELTSTNGQVATLWIANIIVFAISMRNDELRGPAGLAGIFVGNVVANLIKGSSLVGACLFGVLSVIYIALLIHFALGLLAKQDAASNPVRTFATALVAFAGITGAIAVALGAATTALLQWNFSATASQWFINNVSTSAIFLRSSSPSSAPGSSSICI